MENLLFYLLQVSLILVCLDIVYFFFLQKNTFHRINRFVLLANVFLSLLLPLIKIPALEMEQSIQSVDAIYAWIASQQTQPLIESPADNLSLAQLAIYFYWGVVGVLLINLVIQLLSFIKLIRKSEKQRSHTSPYIIAYNKAVTSPFSFFRFVILNPANYSAQTVEQILRHEAIHVQQRHTIDILIARIYTVFFWFNPFAWWHFRLIKLNLEYLADEGVVQSGVSNKTYQFNLLQISLYGTSYSLTNNFNQSFIKKRITMMNKQTSSGKARIHYLLILPVICGLLLFFNSTNSRAIPFFSTTHPYLSMEVTESSRHSAIVDNKQQVVSGKVSDANTGNPISGVKVVAIQGINSVSLEKAAGVTTDKDGRFSITFSGKEDVLVFYSLNYEPTKIAIGEANELKVHLKPKGEGKDMAFSAEAKKITMDLKPGEKAKDNTISFSAGESVTINVTEEEEKIELKGEPTQVKFNGSANNEPLYILDGNEISKEKHKEIDPNSIESISVIKDESAVKKYGEKGKNGVIEFHLKK